MSTYVYSFIYQGTFDTFIGDEEMRKRLADADPITGSARGLVSTFLEAQGRGYHPHSRRK